MADYLNITYCDGTGCVLRERCIRYVDGKRIKQNVNCDTNQYYFIDHCDVDVREGYMEIKNMI